MAKKINSPFELLRENDYVEYYIFPKFSKEIVNEMTKDTAHTKEVLEQLKREYLHLVDKLIKERQYIWHKDAFQLQVRTCSKEEEKFFIFSSTNKSLSAEKAAEKGTATGTKPKAVASMQMPPHLYGVTHYGDNITDEWFIVFLLKEITKHFPDVVARVVDADGEFLLIEAAHVLPKWANPYTCEQRVYFLKGHVHLIKNSPTNTNSILTIAEALEILDTCPSAHRVATDIEDCIDQRLKDFTFQEGEKITLFHNQIVRVPVGVAAVLKARPDLIAPAIRAFCERDALDMKACRSMLYFPPEQRVRINVRFTRCLYAMLMHSNYMPERKIGWNLNTNQRNTEEFKENLLGIKLACGFEILASQAKQIEDNGNGYDNRVENSPAWKTYINSLVANGYFRNELIGSQEYQRLLNQAKKHFLETELSFRTLSDVGNEILQLLKTLDINVEALKSDEKNLKVSDSDNWLNITPEELDEILIKRYGLNKLYKTNGDIDAAEFTNNIAEFLEKQSGMEGIARNSNSDTNTDDDDDNDNDADADIDDDSDTATNNKKSTSKKIGNRFKQKQHQQEHQEQRRIKIKKNLSMRRACKKQNNSSNNNSLLDNTLPDGCSGKEESITEQMRSSLNFTLPEDLWDFYSDSDMDDYGHDDNDENDEENLSTMMNALRNEEEDIDKDIKAYMDEMDKELANTTIGQTFSNRPQHKQPSYNADNDNHADDDNFDDIENFEPIDINVNTLKNLMDSYKNQLGGTGPVTHLLNAMGAGMSTARNTDVNNDDDHGGPACNLRKNEETNLTESRV